MGIKGTVYYDIFIDVYELQKQFMPVQTSDEYWEAFISGADKIFRKYKGTEQEAYTRKLILTIADELERISKNGKVANQ